MIPCLVKAMSSDDDDIAANKNWVVLSNHTRIWGTDKPFPSSGASISIWNGDLQYGSAPGLRQPPVVGYVGWLVCSLWWCRVGLEDPFLIVSSPVWCFELRHLIVRRVSFDGRCCCWMLHALSFLNVAFWNGREPIFGSLSRILRCVQVTLRWQKSAELIPMKVILIRWSRDRRDWLTLNQKGSNGYEIK